MNTLDDILAAARSLPLADRSRLIPLLWDQALPEDWPAPSAAWITEANNRSNAIDTGTMSADDWSNVRERARRQAGLSE